MNPLNRADSPSSAEAPGARLPLLLTADEVAEILRTTRKAVYGLAERKQLPGVKRIGRRLLVRRTALLEWLAERDVSSPEARR